MRWIGRCACGAALALVLGTTAVRAQPAPAGETFPPGGVAEVLRARIGKPATLVLRSGKDVTGTVGEVRDGTVVVSRLQGREFFDAIVRLDDVSSVELRMRER